MLVSLGFYPATPAMAAQVQPVIYTIFTAPTIVEAYAVKYGIPAKPLIDTLSCESHFNASAIGDKGKSFGVAQIHLPSHPNITKEQALDPLWAIDWTAQQFKAGKAKMWTCYRILYPGSA